MGQKECEEELNVSPCNGEGRVAFFFRKVVVPFMQKMIHAKFCKREQRLTEALLRMGSEMFVRDSDALNEVSVCQGHAPPVRDKWKVADRGQIVRRGGNFGTTWTRAALRAC